LRERGKGEKRSNAKREGEMIKMRERERRKKK
jgi:hypothetical protein